jgi:hypothetical protein
LPHVLARVKRLNYSPMRFVAQDRSLDELTSSETGWPVEIQSMLEVLNTWSFEALAIVVGFALVASSVIALTQGRKR